MLKGRFEVRPPALTQPALPSRFTLPLRSTRSAKSIMSSPPPSLADASSGGPEQLKPFRIQLAERINRLPPYLLARINALLYHKRQAGQDVIDLGMGNPTDPPEDFVIEKLAEAARDPRQPRLQQVERHRQPAPRGGRQVLQEVRRAARSRERGDRPPRLEGRLQPHVPGDDGAGRHGDRAGAVLSRSTCTPIALASGNVITLEVGDSEKFLSNIAYTCEHLTRGRSC